MENYSKPKIEVKATLTKTYGKSDIGQRASQLPSKLSCSVSITILVGSTCIKRATTYERLTDIAAAVLGAKRDMLDWLNPVLLAPESYFDFKKLTLQSNGVLGPDHGEVIFRSTYSGFSDLSFEVENVSSIKEAEAAGIKALTEFLSASGKLLE